MATLFYRSAFASLKRGLLCTVLAASMAGTSLPAHAVADLKKDIADRRYPLSLSGSYLAALTANRSKDLAAASLYYDRVLSEDPKNSAILERAFFLRFVDGQVEEALGFTDDILKTDPTNWFAHMLRGVTSLKAKSFRKAAKDFELLKEGPLAILTGTLLQAWTLAGDGKLEEAYERLNSLSGQNEAFEEHRLYHSALIATFSNDVEKAKDDFKAAFEANPNLIHRTEAYTRFLLRGADREEGEKLLKRLVDRIPGRPSVQKLVEESKDGKKPAANIKSVSEGAMEVLYGLGNAIGTEGNKDVTYIYMNLASYLEPNNPLPSLFLGELLEDDDRFKRAIEVYADVHDDPRYGPSSRLRSAYAYNRMDMLKEARDMLDELIASDPNNVIYLTSYGNILRARELFEDAEKLYSKAISQLPGEPRKQDWALFYSRGITYERTKKWDKAEADFRKALKLSPDEPQVLNYLGYSLIDLGMKYEEALGMIQTAVRLRPNDAFIIDSLGWAYYKLAEYDKAVKHLERAVELRPHDPILNDHLGDAYWKVGRKLEAQFQWRHARDLDPEPKDLVQILKKLQNGLEAKKDG